MKNEIVKKERFITLRDGTIISLGSDEKRYEAVAYALTSSGGEKPYLEVGGQIINTADVTGVFFEDGLKSRGCLSAVGDDVTDRLNEEGADKFKWIVASKSGNEIEISSKEYYDLIQIMKSRRSGKVIIRAKSVELLDITSINFKEEHEHAKKLRSGYWECTLGNLHEKGEKFCDKFECYLKNHTEYQAAWARAHNHHNEGNCPLPQNNLGTWHLCETTQKEYNYIISIEAHARSLFGEKD